MHLPEERVSFGLTIGELDCCRCGRLRIRLSALRGDGGRRASYNRFEASMPKLSKRESQIVEPHHGRSFDQLRTGGHLSPANAKATTPAGLQ